MICSYFGITFLLFFMKIENAVLHTLPKLSTEHIKLTPCLKMNVTLAAQVLISVSKVLLAYSPPEAAATACFMLASLRSVNDQRFSWLCKVFFKSFHDD